MKRLFCFLVLLFVTIASSAQNPILRGSGTTNSPLIQLYSMPVFSVLNYGVVPGRTLATAVNEQAGIQAAIDAAGAAGGGCVWLPKGVYGLGTNFVHPTYLTEALPSALIMPSNNVFLMCESPGSATITQLVFVATGNNVIAAGNDATVTGPANVGLINLRVCGKTGSGFDLTQFQSTTNTFFIGCIFENAGQDAIDVQSGNAVYVQNCVFSNITGNAVSTANDNTIIDGFQVHGIVGGDFEVFTGKNTIMNGSFRNTTNCITITGADSVNIENVTFENPNVNSTNCHVSGTSLAKFRNCYFSGGGANGASIIVITNGQLEIDRCRFLDKGITALRPARLIVNDSFFLTGSSASLRVQGGTTVLIDGNEFSATDAVRFTDGVPNHNSQFLNNRCAANYYTDSGGTNRIIANNYFQDCEIRFQADEANCYIANNVMKGSLAQFEHAGGGHLVVGNILRDVNFLSTATSTFRENQVLTVSGNDTGIKFSYWSPQLTNAYFLSSTNALILNDGYQSFTATANVAITNVVGQVANTPMWATLNVTNSTAGVITQFITASGVRAFGTGSTNALVIPSGKIGTTSFYSSGTLYTNYVNTTQQ